MSKASARKRESTLYVRQAAKGSLSKGWKKKYVIIRQNKGSSGKSVLLELYIEKGAHNKPVISLLLENVDSITRIPTKLREHAFEIKSGEKNLFCVSAESEIEAYEWMDVFNQHLLEPKKEIGKLPEIEDDFCRVSVIPNKDSQRLDLQGDYYTVVRDMKVALYDPYTGHMKIQWDMHHLKKVLVTTKCHFRDKERIMHFCVSSRSDHGKSELHFFSLQAKRLADAIFEVLSGNISVTSRTTRSASMIFEITSKDLKKMMKNKDPEAESVASLVMDEPMKEEPAEISVQTIPEEMDPAEDKDLQKEPKTDVIKTSENEDKEGKIEENGVQVNGEQDPGEINGHASEANEQNEKVNGEVTEDQMQQDPPSTAEKIPDCNTDKESSDVKENETTDKKEEKTLEETNESKDTEGQIISDQNDEKVSAPESGTISESAPSVTVDNVPTSSSNQTSNTTNEESPSPAGDKEDGDIPEKEKSKNTESEKELNQDNTDNVVAEEGGVCQETSKMTPEHCEQNEQKMESKDDVTNKQSEQSEDAPDPETSPESAEPSNSSKSAELTNTNDSNEPINSTDSGEPTDSNDSVEPTKPTESAETTDSTTTADEPQNSTDSAESTNTTDAAELTNSSDPAEYKDPADPKDSAELRSSTDQAEPVHSTNSPEPPTSISDPESDSKPVNNQTLPHDTSTDSGFINDSVEPSASINTNNNNSREDLNDEHCSDVEKASVLPEYGLPVDVADLEDFSVIVYSQESPEKLV